MVDVGERPQPDIALRMLPEFGGTSRASGELVTGPPELVVEISYWSGSLVLGRRAELYQTAGVPEYVVALLEGQRVEWRVLDGGSYRLIQTNPAGVYESLGFPGLWLNEAAFWQEDNSAMMATLEEGLRATSTRRDG
jgi:Uma2 family endonuclease